MSVSRQRTLILSAELHVLPNYHGSAKADPNTCRWHCRSAFQVNFHVWSSKRGVLPANIELTWWIQSPTSQSLESTVAQVCIFFSLSAFSGTRGMRTQMVLITPWTSIPNSSDHDVPHTVVTLAATLIGDLDLATTVWAWRGVFLLVVGEGDGFASVLIQGLVGQSSHLNEDRRVRKNKIYAQCALLHKSQQLRLVHRTWRSHCGLIFVSR